MSSWHRLRRVIPPRRTGHRIVAVSGWIVREVMMRKLVFWQSRERLAVKSKSENVQNGTSLPLLCD
jgi:hypothetical protein